MVKGRLCGQVEVSSNPTPAVNLRAQVPEAGNARCLLTFSVQVVLMVRVACVFIIVDEGQLVCREGTWGRV